MKRNDIVYLNNDPEKRPCLVVVVDGVNASMRAIAPNGGTLLQMHRQRAQTAVTVIERLVCTKDACYGEYSQAHHRACQSNQFTHGEMEAAIDIALHAGALIIDSEIHVADSRELVQFVIDSAVDFEERFIAENDPESYMDEVEKFADRVLREKYGQTKESPISGLIRKIREEKKKKNG